MANTTDLLSEFYLKFSDEMSSEMARQFGELMLQQNEIEPVTGTNTLKWLDDRIEELILLRLEEQEQEQLWKWLRLSDKEALQDDDDWDTFTSQLFNEAGEEFHYVFHRVNKGEPLTEITTELMERVKEELEDMVGDKEYLAVRYWDHGPIGLIDLYTHLRAKDLAEGVLKSQFIGPSSDWEEEDE
jgi:hypothetical protein